MIELEEANLGRLVSHQRQYDICMISASRSENTSQQNNKKTEELESIVRGLGYGFIQLFGGYTENYGTPEAKDVYESSLCVISTDKEHSEIFERQMFMLCRKYKQEAILLSTTNYPIAWYNGNKERISEIKNKLSLSDLSQGFSKIHGTKFAFIGEKDQIKKESTLKSMFRNIVENIMKK